jgi:lipopolysaccharide transport system permease protein
MSGHEEHGKQRSWLTRESNYLPLSSGRLTKDLGYYKDLVYILTKKEIKIRYKSSYFGYLWSLLNPLAFAGIFYFVFGLIWKAPTENYPLFLVAGLFPWQWFSNSMSAATTVYVSNASVIKKVNFPRSILPLATTVQDMFHFLCAIPIIVVLLGVYGRAPAVMWLIGVPLLLVIQLMMVYGLSLALASISLFFRDLQQITGIILMFLFYPTPILYPVSMIPPEYKDLVLANPLAPVILAWRQLFLEGSLSAEYLGIGMVYAALALVVGYWIYSRLKWRFAEVL